MDHIASSLPAKRGLFIAVDGLPMSGVTTATQLLKDGLNAYLNRRNRTEGVDYVLLTSEMSTRQSDNIKKAILELSVFDNPIITALLLGANYRYWLDNIVKPMIEEGKIVIADGFVLTAHSSLHPLDVDTRQRVFDLAVGYDEADFTFFIDVDPETIAHRVHSRPRPRGHYMPMLDVAGQVARRNVILELINGEDEFDQTWKKVQTIDGNQGFPYVNAQLSSYLDVMLFDEIEKRIAANGQPRTLSDLIRDNS